MKNFKKIPLSEVVSATRYRSKSLSPRETEVLTLSAQGKTGPEIAIATIMSEDAVKDHLERIRRKLNTVNKTHSVAVAVFSGIIKF